MSKVQTLSSYQQLVQELKKLCADKRTGTMFITTNDNHSARFALHSGKIVACAYTLKKGYDALPLIQHIKSGSFAFADGVLSGMRELPLPETEVMLEVLGGGSEADSEDNSAIGGAANVQPQTEKDVGGEVIFRMGAAIKDVETELAEFVGPVADFICQEYIEDVGELTGFSDVVKMIEAVAVEIGNPKEENQFKQRSMARIKGEYNI